MSNNIGIGLPNNYNRGVRNGRNMQVPSRVSSIPQLSNYSINNIHEVLGNNAIDAVIIASSTSAHEEHILACIEFNKPFIFNFQSYTSRRS